MPAPIADDVIEKIRRELAFGASIAETAATCDVAKSTVSRVKSGELAPRGDGAAGDTNDEGRRVARVRPAEIDQPDDEEGQSEADTVAQELEYLRARNAELTEHVCDMSIELVRLQRLLRAQQEG